MPEGSGGKDHRDHFRRRQKNHPKSRTQRAFEHFQHQETPPIIESERLREKQADESIKLYFESGKLVLPSDFSMLTRKVRGLDAVHDVSSSDHQTVGKLKYDLIATVLGVLPDDANPTHDQKQWQRERENVRKEAMARVNPESNTARGVFLILLDHFANDPSGIPASSLKLISQNIVGLDFTKARETLDVENSDVGIKEQASKRLLPFYSDVYSKKSSTLLGKTSAAPHSADEQDNPL